MIHRSPLADVGIPEAPLTDFVLANAGSYPERAALVDGTTGRTVTYGELSDAIARLAAGLQARGFGRGDVFGIYCPNTPEFAVAFFAVAALGGTCTTVNPLYTADELAFQLDDAGARFLLTVPDFLDKAKEAASRTTVSEIFVLGEAEGATPLAALLDNDGTFERPRIDVTEDVVVLPFFHIYGMTVIMGASLHRGFTVVTLPRFELEPFCETIQNHKVTIAYVVPPIVLALAKHPAVDDYDLSSLKFLNSGAAPLGEDLAAACAERLGCVIKQGYGMTETSPVTHTNPFGGKIKVGTVGITIPNTECKIVDIETLEELGPGETGELLIRGPQVMRGYLNRPEATADCLDDDGWLRTGDIAVADEEGYFRIVDRLKEFIKYKGYQVAPAELEDILMGHPAVADAAVVPSPDEEAGEVPKAFLVLHGEADTNDILAYVAERVAPYKKIRRLELVEEIPKSASGKILRRLLIERERDAVSGR